MTRERQSRSLSLTVLDLITILAIAGVLTSVLLPRCSRKPAAPACAPATQVPAARHP